MSSNVKVERKMILGPAGSGKTQHLLEAAHRFSQAGDRVTWVALPHQREGLLRRLSQQPSLGIRVTDLQSLMFEALELGQSAKRPLSVASRVALVGRILAQQDSQAAEPGEATLYALGIAETKRSHLSIPPIFKQNRYQSRLQEVFMALEAELNRRALLDPDDVRREAIDLLEGNTRLELGHLIVDGYNSFNPMELRAIRALAGSAQSVQVSLPVKAPHPFISRVLESEAKAMAQFLGVKTQMLRPRALPHFAVRPYPNPSSEARGVLAQVKAALQSGSSAHDLLILVPHAVYKRALLSLAQEFGVPLRNTQTAPALERPEGQQLLRLLSVTTRGYPLRDLQALEGLYNLEDIVNALSKRELGGDGVRFLAQLEEEDTQNLNLNAYRVLLEETTLEGHAGQVDLQSWLTFMDRLLLRVRLPDPEAVRLVARETYTLLPDPSPAALLTWMRALLQDVELQLEPPSGVRLALTEEVSGSRFEQCWMMGTLEGSYTLDESEDFFYPEEERDGTLLEGLLPKMRGRAASVFYEALWRAKQTTLSYPLADRSGKLRPHVLIDQLSATVQPFVPSIASPLEYALTHREAAPAAFDWSHLPPLEENRAFQLVRFLPCRLRGLLQHQLSLPQSGSVASSQELESLRRRLRQAHWDGLEEPHTRAGWSNTFAEEVGKNLRKNLPPPPPAGVMVNRSVRVGELQYRPHAYRLERTPPKLEVYLVHPQGETVPQVRDQLEALWLLAAFRNQAGRIAPANLWAWDLYTEPRRLSIPESDLARAVKRLEELRGFLARGDFAPTPGFHCRGCRWGDICRVGT